MQVIQTAFSALRAAVVYTAHMVLLVLMDHSSVQRAKLHNHYAWRIWLGDDFISQTQQIHTMMIRHGFHVALQMSIVHIKD